MPMKAGGALEGGAPGDVIPAWCPGSLLRSIDGGNRGGGATSEAAPVTPGTALPTEIGGDVNPGDGAISDPVKLSALKLERKMFLWPSFGSYFSSMFSSLLES